MLSPRSRVLALAALLVASTATGCKKAPCGPKAHTQGAHYCLELPDGLSLDGERDDGAGPEATYRPKGKGAPVMTVLWLKDAADFASQAKVIELRGKAAKAPGSNQQVTAEGKPEGFGEGAFLAVTLAGGKSASVDYLVKDGGKAALCRTHTSVDDAARVLSACKTLRFVK